MASFLRPNIQTFKAAGTIPAFACVKFSTDNDHVVQAGAGDQACGIAQNQASVTTGQMVEVALPGGGAKGNCGATWTNLGPVSVKPDASGNLVKASDTDFAIGMAYHVAATGDAVEVFIMPHFAGATQS